MALDTIVSGCESDLIGLPSLDEQMSLASHPTDVVPLQCRKRRTEDTISLRTQAESSNNARSSAIHGRRTGRDLNVSSNADITSGDGPSLLKRRRVRYSQSSSLDVGKHRKKGNYTHPHANYEKHLSCLEKLPKEVLQIIATDLATDIDLSNFTKSSPKIAQAVVPHNCEVWRNRFLARYDYPLIGSVYEFRPAYALRRFVLCNFASYGTGMNEQGIIQLETIRDMILEAYNQRLEGLARGCEKSKNMRIFTSPVNAPWVKLLLTSPFVNFDNHAWGEPHSVFESIQLTLSHLLLSPKSAFSHMITTSRNNYDMTKVYNFKQSFSMLYTRETYVDPPTPVKSNLFPNLPPRPGKRTVLVNLDTNALLHIRNFWHRHLTCNVDTISANGLATLNQEHTYASMMDHLSELGKIPQEWQQSLLSDIKLKTEWHGHYSAVSPWPSSRQKLDEQQSIAETWDTVEPLKLDFVKSTEYSDGFWPVAFSTIPAFAETTDIPAISDEEVSELFQSLASPLRSKGKEGNGNKQTSPKAQHGPTYIRGVASFIDIDTAVKEKREKANNIIVNPTATLKQSARTNNNLLKYHPFTSLRICGVVHDIDPGATVSESDIPLGDDGTKRAANYAIPGWKRITMVLWKPSKRYLLSVLEHAEEEYGGAFSVGLSNAMQNSTTNTANIWSTQVANQPNSNDQQQPATPQSQLQTQTQSTNTINSIAFDPDAIETHLRTLLQTKLSTYLKTHYIQGTHEHLDQDQDQDQTQSEMTVKDIIHLENAYASPHFLDWSDGTIEYAYAYEGAIIPGGQIMMGRYWRCHGIEGLGPGREVDVNGQGVDFAAAEEGHDNSSISSSSSSAAASPSSSSSAGPIADDGCDGRDQEEEESGTVADVDEMDIDKDGGGGSIGHDNNATEISNSSVAAAARNSTRQPVPKLERGPFIFWC